MHRGTSFPVGKVDFLDLFPLNFFEFLNALGEDDLVKGLENLRAHIIILKNFHSNIVVALNKFATDTKKEIALSESHSCNL